VWHLGIGSAMPDAPTADTVVGWTGNLSIGGDADNAQCVVVDLVGVTSAGSPPAGCPPPPQDAKCCQFVMDGANHYFSVPMGVCGLMGGQPINSDTQCVTAPTTESCVIS